MNERVSQIYALLDPISGAPRYVGKSAQGIDRRMASHRREARVRAKTPKHLWISGLAARKLSPKVVVLDSVSVAESARVERRWVARLARFNLLNVRVAGAGNPGIGRVVWTNEWLSKLGTVPDSDIAREIGCERKTVAYRRECLNIPACVSRKNNTPPPPMGGWNRKKLPPEIEAQIGKLPDYVLGEMADVCKTVISRARKRLGIKSYAEATGCNGRIQVGEAHRRWSR